MEGINPRRYGPRSVCGLYVLRFLVLVGPIKDARCCRCCCYFFCGSYVPVLPSAAVVTFTSASIAPLPLSLPLSLALASFLAFPRNTGAR